MSFDQSWDIAMQTHDSGPLRLASDFYRVIVGHNNNTIIFFYPNNIDIVYTYVVLWCPPPSSYESVYRSNNIDHSFEMRVQSFDNSINNICECI